MRPRTLLLLLLSLVLLVPLVAAYGLWSIDSAYLRRLIVTRVEQATGRSFTIDGPVAVSWSLHPTFTLNNVVLANTPGAAEPTMATLDRLVLQVAALSLLRGRPDLERLSLTGLDLLFEPGADGAGNWDFQPRPQPLAEPAAADMEPADAGSLPIVRQVLIADARVRYRDEAGATTELKLTRAAFDASPANASGTFGLAGSLDGEPLRSSGRLGPIDASTGADPLPLTVADFSAALGGSDFAGSASLRLDGERPRVEADLTADRLDLRRSAAPPDSPENAVRGGELFSRSPLPMDVLRRLDLQLRLHARTVQTAIGELAQMELAATLEAGRLTIEPLGFRLQDRPVAGGLVVDAADEPARVELQLRGDDLDIGRVLASPAHGAGVEGRGDVRVQVTGRGPTFHALASSATGRATALIGAGTLPSGLVGQFAGVFQCAALYAQVENGLVRLDLLADGPHGPLVGGGTIDLDRERIDLILTPQGPQLDHGGALPVTVRGPLASPDVDLADADVSRRAASRPGAIPFPPAALAAFSDLTGATGNACLAGAIQTDRLAEPATVGPDAGIVERIEGVGRELPEAARSAP